MSPLAADLEPVCEHIDGRVWDGLRGQSLFITGGTGFVGSWLVECLLHANRTRHLDLGITVLSRNPGDFLSAYPHLAADKALQMHQGDIRCFEFPAARFDMAVHAALPVAASTAGTLAEAASRGATRMAEFVQAKGVRRLLHVSSGAVYGPQPDEVSRLVEQATWDPALPANDYTQAKRAEERILGQVAAGGVTARCFALIGPGLSPSTGMAAASFMARAAEEQAIEVQGDGKAVRSYQYAADLAAWLITLLVMAPHRGIYNVGSEEAISVAQLAQRISDIAGLQTSVRVLGNAIPGRAGARYVPSTARARHEFGLTNLFGLDQALTRTLQWQRERATTIAP